MFQKNCYWRLYSRSSETTTDILMVTKDKILTVNGATTQKKRIIGPSTRFWADDMKGTFWPYVAMLGLAVICPIDENRHF